jgi:hypothetical protein
MRRVPLVLAFVLVLAGCGNSKPDLFTRAKTQQCLVKKKVRIGGRLDFIASTATGGAFKARLAKNSVTVVFGLTEDDARQIELAYKRAAAKNVGVGDILARSNNVVLLWRQHPSDLDLQTVANCLK